MAQATEKLHDLRKRVVVGWRQMERRRLEIRLKHKPPPIPKREG